MQLSARRQLPHGVARTMNSRAGGGSVFCFAAQIAETGTTTTMERREVSEGDGWRARRCA